MRRRFIAEQMDAADVDPARLRRALAFIRKINRYLRYNATTAQAVGKLGGETLLDVACGSADFADYTPVGMCYVGLDFHAGTLAIAREWQPGAALVRGDALRLPLADDSVDVAVCQMALHHFDTDDARRLLAEMDRVSRRGWVAADLLRRRRATVWIGLFTMFSDPMVKHDARVSVRQAWSPAEARALGERFGATYRGVLGHRFMLVKRHARG